MCFVCESNLKKKEMKIYILSLHYSTTSWPFLNRTFTTRRFCRSFFCRGHSTATTFLHFFSSKLLFHNNCFFNNISLETGALTRGLTHISSIVFRFELNARIIPHLESLFSIFM